MTITQSRTLDGQIARENALIDSWVNSDDYNSIIDLSDLDDEDGLDYDEGDFIREYADELSGYVDELYDGGDWSQD